MTSKGGFLPAGICQSARFWFLLLNIFFLAMAAILLGERVESAPRSSILTTDLLQPWLAAERTLQDSRRSRSVWRLCCSPFRSSGSVPPFESHRKMINYTTKGKNATSFLTESGPLNLPHIKLIHAPNPQGRLHGDLLLRPPGSIDPDALPHDVGFRPQGFDRELCVSALGGIRTTTPKRLVQLPPFL